MALGLTDRVWKMRLNAAVAAGLALVTEMTDVWSSSFVMFMSRFSWLLAGVTMSDNKANWCQKNNIKK